MIYRSEDEYTMIELFNTMWVSRITIKHAGQKKGVSSIISAMLLIVIVMSAFSLLYAATQNWITAQRRDPLLAMQERFIIEDAWFRTVNTSDEIATIYVRNGGKVDVTVLRCRIDGAYYPISPLRIELPPGWGGYFNITINWDVDTTYEITVITERGSSITSYETT